MLQASGLGKTEAPQSVAEVSEDGIDILVGCRIVVEGMCLDKTSRIC